MNRDKIITADEAIALIRDGDVVSCSGFVGIGTPEALIAALERRFVETAAPAELDLVFAAAPGDGKERGLNRLAHEGLVKRAVGGHWALVPQAGARWRPTTASRPTTCRSASSRTSTATPPRTAPAR